MIFKKLLAVFLILITSQGIADADKNRASEDQQASLYALSPGDMLDISVWKDENMHQQLLIAPDGYITFPLIGSIMAGGKTVTEVAAVITEKLSDFIVDPIVNVSLANQQGNIIFVIGKVNQPGRYITNREIDVLQAISLAGGLTVFADEDSISVIRHNSDETDVFPFDYSDVINGEELQQNILLKSGDTVAVP